MSGASFPHRHLLGIEGLAPADILFLLDRAEAFMPALQTREGRQALPQLLSGLCQINLFFEASTRTQSSFEPAGARLGAHVVTMTVGQSSVKKGETLLDTAMTLNAMRPDLLVIRHSAAGAPHLLAQKLDCSLVNAGDGRHEHPTQALLDALTIRHYKKRIEGLVVVICGDVLHSRVARSNIFLLTKLGAQVRLVGPSSLLPKGFADLGVSSFTRLGAAVEDADIVMALRLQRERMEGSYVSSERDYAHFFGLSHKVLARAKPDVLVMHPGPVMRGVDMTSDLADGPLSLIQQQVERGIAVRMAVLASLIEARP